MRTSQLEYFVAAAESLSFTDAAQRCHVAQPAVSQQIRRLEEELGFELFRRERGGLALTDAGVLYYREASEALRRLGWAREQGSKVASGKIGVLTIGACGPTQGSDLRLLELFHAACPEVELRFVGLTTSRQAEQLSQGVFDVCYTDTSQLAGMQDACFARRETRGLCVMANRSNPLACRTSVTTEEVMAQTLIFAEPNGNNEARALFSEGVGGRIFTDTQENVQLMLRLDLGVAVAPDSVATSLSDDIVVIPTRGDWPKIELAWAYLATNENPALHTFVDYLDQRE